jgi:hypothetical protein
MGLSVQANDLNDEQSGRRSVSLLRTNGRLTRLAAPPRSTGGTQRALNIFVRRSVRAWEGQ